MFDYRVVLQQLGGAGRLAAMVGAKITYDNKNQNVGIRFKGSTKANYVRITLNGKDLYDMEFLKIRGTSFKTVQTYNDVYGDQLKELFEKFTGLYLSLR